MMKPALLLFFMLFAGQAISQKPIIPGDFPDPSVVKIGDTFYASATSSNWAPAYPIMKSNDLQNWEQIGYIFPKLADWADYYYWAPELNYENGKVYVYYTAHKKNGNLCVGIASADKPEGPYTDHGPLICESAGSIDAFPVRDENNKLHLIWKEDGNSVGKPTPIWIQPLNETRTALTGEKKELFRNDAPWEANLVEGVSIVKNKGYFYAIYAAAGCCGSGCSYATGVARSRKLAGPWEKFPGNPVLTNQNNWICPGHGTAVVYKGKNYFMYHAYDKESNKYTGRQALLQQFEFTKDNWIHFTNDFVSPADTVTTTTTTDTFDNPDLDLQWNWSVFRQPDLNIRNGRLEIMHRDTKETFIGRRIMGSNYEATVETVPDSSGWSGVALIGDDKNLIYAAAAKDSIRITAVKDSIPARLASLKLPGSGSHVFLKLIVKNNTDLQFAYSTDGNNFVPIETNKPDISYLPPWDRALRTGIIVKGEPGKVSAIEKFVLMYP